MVRFLILSLTLSVSCMARADILFEGYSKITSGGVHVGYSIARYEFDNKKKQFIATTFVKTNELGGNLTESVKATANENLKPISYQYTVLIDKQVKTIDAKVVGERLSAVVKDGSKAQKTLAKDLPKGSFLSSLLVYVILRSPKGFSADTRYEYQAVAEEDGDLVKGVAVIKGEEDYKGHKVFRVLNEFKGTKFTSFVTNKGEVLSTKNPLQGIATELVAQPSDATGNIAVPTAILKTLFGDVPTGQKNAISKKSHEAPKK